MSGWFAIKRGTLEHEMFAPVGKWSRFEAWTWMIENAVFKPTVIDLAGHPYTVPRGSLCYSLRFMAEHWSWSVKSVRSFLNQLERHGAIKILSAQVGNKRGTARTQINLCNYEKYQSYGHSMGTAGAQQGHKEEQGNNIPVGEAEKSAPADPAKIIFDSGREILVGSGKSHAEAGKILGMWRNKYGDANLIAAIGRAQRESAIDPVAFITGALKFTSKQNQQERPGHTNGGAFGSIPERA